MASWLRSHSSIRLNPLALGPSSYAREGGFTGG